MSLTIKTLCRSSESYLSFLSTQLTKELLFHDKIKVSKMFIERKVLPDRCGEEFPNFSVFYLVHFTNSSLYFKFDTVKHFDLRF